MGAAIVSGGAWAEEGVAAPPVWRALADELAAEIAAGRLADGARLAPERAMAAARGVAVGTLRRALAALAAEGLLERRQGAGTWVRHAGLGRAVYGLFRLERADGAPGVPRAEVLDLRPGRAPAWAPFREATRVRRLRRLGGDPAAVEEIWLDAACGRLAAEAAEGSLYLAYARLLGLQVAETEDRVGVGAMPPWAPPPLAPGASGHVARLARVAGGRVVEASETWFDPSRARYVNRQARGAGRGRPAAGGAG